MGKTALLMAAREAAQSDGIRVLRARGAELEREFGFGRPEPPCGTGSPDKAPAELVQYVLGMVEPLRVGLAEFVARATVPV
jgi:hypothetical protein